MNFLDLPLKSRRAAFAKMDAADKAKKGANLKGKKPRRPAAKKAAAKKPPSGSVSDKRAQIDRMKTLRKESEALRRKVASKPKRSSGPKTIQAAPKTTGSKLDQLASRPFSQAYIDSGTPSDDDIATLHARSFQMTGKGLSPAKLAQLKRRQKRAKK